LTFADAFGIPLLANVRYHQTVAAFSARMTSLPDFQLAPATSLDRMEPKFGLRANRFDSHPDFAKRYWLRGDDEIAVRSTLQRCVLGSPAVADPGEDWFIEKAGRWPLVCRHNLLCAPHAVPTF